MHRLKVLFLSTLVFMSSSFASLASNPYWEALAAADYSKASELGLQLAEQDISYLYLSAVADQFRFEYGDYYDKKDYYLELTEGDLSKLQAVLDSNYTAANYNLLNIYGFISLTMEDLQLEEPRSYFEKSLSLQPENGYANNYIAYISIREKKLEEGVRHGELAIAQKPDMPEAYNNLAFAYGQLDQRNSDKPITTLINCLARCPKNTYSTYYNLMYYICEEQVIMIDSTMVSGPGIASDSIRTRVINALRPYPGNLLDLAAAFTEYRGYHEASLLLEAVKPQDNLRLRYYFNRGVLAAKTRQTAVIKESFDELLALNAFSYALDLAYELYGSQNFALLLELLLKLQDIAETMDQKMQVHSNIGTVYLQLEEYVKAISKFESVLEYAPNDDITLTNLGVSWHLLGDDEKGLRYLNQAKENCQTEEQMQSIERWLKIIQTPGE